MLCASKDWIVGTTFEAVANGSPGPLDKKMPSG